MEPWFPTFRRWAVESRLHPTRSLASTREGQSRSLVRLIAVATEERLALVPLLKQWAIDEGGHQETRLQQLIELLSAGTPLADAIEQVPGLLHDEDALAIRFDSRSGTATAAMRDVLSEPRETAARYIVVARRSTVYVLGVLLVCVLLFAFMSIKIMPSFEKIMEDFGLRPPEPFAWYQAFSRSVAALWWLLALAVCGALWMVFSTSRGRAIRQGFLLRSFQPLSELRAAGILQTLRIAIDAGRPITGALSTLARYHFDPVARSKLLFVRNEVEQGADPWQSMTEVGLLTREEVRLLTTAERLGNRGWAVNQLVLRKRRHALRRLERTADLLLPVLLVLLGSLVLFQALAVLVPLAQMITTVL